MLERVLLENLRKAKEMLTEHLLATEEIGLP